MNRDYVQFGCGICAPPTWRNFDAGPAFWLQKYVPFSTGFLTRRGYPKYPTANIQYGDIIRGLPIKVQSAQGMYCSHVLEHLSLQGFRTAIRNVFSYLAPGGRFRMVLPDLEFVIKTYLADSSEQAASRFMKNGGLGEETENGSGMSGLARGVFSRSRHLSMWDYKGLSAELARAGFVDIRRASFHDSEDPRFAEVEEEGRWKDCLGAECRRPA